MADLKKPKEKNCKVCTKSYLQWNSTIQWCSADCGIKLLEVRKKQKYDKKTIELTRNYRANNRSFWTHKTQKIFNKFIRLRDSGSPCVSCGTANPDIQYCAGHYKTIAARPDLRFSEWNVNLQCNYHCNKMKSGNISGYRKGLIEKIGIEKVESLERDTDKHKKLTLDDIKSIFEYYKVKINETNS